jgi:hypothetical protein
MDKADLKITIQGGETEGRYLRFKPGETMQGSLQITPRRDINCRHVYVRILWQTEGRGIRDRGVAEELDVFQGKLRAETPIYYSFHFRLPDGPWSYAGYYINIIWLVEISIDLAMATDLKATKLFILAPA